MGAPAYPVSMALLLELHLPFMTNIQCLEVFSDFFQLEMVFIIFSEFQYHFFYAFLSALTHSTALFFFFFF